MAFSGVDSIVAAKTAGKRRRIPFNRTVFTGATSVAGRWHELLSQVGTGGPMTLTGTAGTGIVMDRTKSGALPIGPDVSPDLRHLQSALAITGGATLAPGIILLTDIIHIYPSIALTGTPSTLSNHPTWTGSGDTRMTNAEGVEASLIVTTAGTAGNGQIGQLTYTNSAGTAGKASGTMYAPAATAPAGCLYGETGAAATVGGPYFPRAAGDLGIQSVQSYTITTGLTTGVGCLMLHRPIAEIPLAAINTPGMMEWIIGERIFDNACLGMFIQIGGAATAGQQITGSLETVWG